MSFIARESVGGGKTCLPAWGVPRSGVSRPPVSRAARYTGVPRDHSRGSGNPERNRGVRHALLHFWPKMSKGKVRPIPWIASSRERAPRNDIFVLLSLWLEQRELKSRFFGPVGLPVERGRQNDPSSFNTNKKINLVVILVLRSSGSVRGCVNLVVQRVWTKKDLCGLCG